MHDVAARIQGRTATTGDIALLQARAKTGDLRALELLAWCEYTGTGLRRDPVMAYLHYGAAAIIGLPTARANQAAIYKSALTAEEKQEVLEFENSRLMRGAP